MPQSETETLRLLLLRFAAVAQELAATIAERPPSQQPNQAAAEDLYAALLHILTEQSPIRGDLWLEAYNALLKANGGKPFHPYAPEEPPDLANLTPPLARSWDFAPLDSSTFRHAFKEAEEEEHMPSEPLSRYDEVAMRFRDVLIEHAAELLPVKWQGRVFPWDDFCKANPAAGNLCRQVEYEMNYEISEFQCSWAVVQFCQQVAQELAATITERPPSQQAKQAAAEDLYAALLHILTEQSPIRGDLWLEAYNALLKANGGKPFHPYAPEEPPDLASLTPPAFGDFHPPINNSTFRHEFKPTKLDPFCCAECGGGRLHPIHQGGTHAR